MCTYKKLTLIFLWTVIFMKIAKTPVLLENLISPSIFFEKFLENFFLLFVAELEKKLMTEWENFPNLYPTKKLFFLQIFANQS